jgi:HEAT repeat protein
MSSDEQARYERRMKHDPRPLEELIATALTEPDEDLAWEAVCVLHFRGSKQVLGRASELCRSPQIAERRLGANILGQLGLPERTFPSECLEILLAMLNGESDASVLQATLVALWHLAQPEAIDPALQLRRHFDPEVRHAVVLALTGYDDNRAIEGLIELSQDEDSDVRDWATFGLGTQIDLDTPAIRQALFQRLTDVDQDTRGEAMVGLAKRKDPRVIWAISEELASDSVSRLAVEAAQCTAAPGLHAQLVALRDRFDIHDAFLEEAIQACSPVPPPKDESGGTP